MMPSPPLATKVLIASRFCGAVAITLKSRMPSRLIASVRGIGVAVSVSTSSTSARSFLSCSFWRTHMKRCSSSMMTRPRILELDVGLDQFVGADHQIDVALGEAVERGSHLLRVGSATAPRF